jgi:hypothetical protein
MAFERHREVALPTPPDPRGPPSSRPGLLFCRTEVGRSVWRPAGRTPATFIEVMQDYGWRSPSDHPAALPHPQTLEPVSAVPALASIAHR